MHKAAYDMVEWNEIKKATEVNVAKIGHPDAEKCDVCVGGPKDSCKKAMDMLRKEVQDIEIIDIEDVSFVLKQSDRRVYCRLKYECKLDATDLDSAEFYHCTRIAIQGNLIQREQFKAYMNNIKMNILEVISDSPIPRELKIYIHKKIGAIVEVNSSESQ